MFSQLSSRWKIALQLAFIVALCVVIFMVLSNMGLMNKPGGDRQVQLRVEASGGYALITLQAGDVTISKPTTVTTPWTRTVQVPAGTTLYLTASNPTQTGKLTCKILLDKLPWKSETTTAPKDGVACAGIVP